MKVSSGLDIYVLTDQGHVWDLIFLAKQIQGVRADRLQKYVPMKTYSSGESEGLLWRDYLLNIYLFFLKKKQHDDQLFLAIEKNLPINTCCFHPKEDLAKTNTISIALTPKVVRKKRRNLRKNNPFQKRVLISF